MILIKKRFFAMVIALLLAIPTFATHIRGGEITAKRISDNSLTYEFTINIYCDSKGGAPACTAANDVTLCLGDGTVVKAVRVSNKDIGNNTSHSIYKYTYTFQVPGVYRVSAIQPNRNADVLNMTNSVNTNFYIATTLVINPFVGLNTTPILLNPPVDFTAIIGQKWTHNPGAFDAEGDSLAYKMVVPQQGTGQEACSGVPVNGYKEPTQVDLACPGTTFSIDSRTGTLTWDTPCRAGQYNVAFVIEEWRKGADGTYTKIGEVIRDMQIIVEDTDNAPPEIIVPPAICVEAGKTVQFTVSASDKVSPRSKRIDPISITSISGVYNQTSPPQFIAPNFGSFVANNTAGTGTFAWATNCNHVRNQPYDILFKVEDAPPSVFPKLVDSKIVKITVVASRPANLRAVPEGARSFRLNWTAYSCIPKGSTSEVVIYRKEGCSAANIDVCKPILPAGYVEIARVPASATAFLDDKNIRRGTNYSYRIGMDFGTGLGTSAVSDESCALIENASVFITNVSIDKTDAATGEITVKWIKPVGLNQPLLKGPYQYRLFRAVGQSGATGFTQITSVNTVLDNKADTIFIDKALNTKDNSYRYRLDFYYTENNKLTILDSTDTASSVRLSAATGVKAIDLSWVANTPWNNQNQKHRVYREIRTRPGTFNLIAEVPVSTTNTFRYTDNGTDTFAADGVINVKMSPDSQYCYRVETVGTYGIAAVRPTVLTNFSQVTCAVARDTIKPCPPVLKIDDLSCEAFNAATPCNQTTFKNTLSWTDPAKNARGEDCDKGLIKYSIYFTASQGGKFDKIGESNVPNMSYIHQNLTTLAGCYYVTATNRFGIESDRSNIVCKDNCTGYKLPNVITPNGDGKNDVFQPIDCPRFVQSVAFVVYDRWGIKVFETNDLNINWKGLNTGGGELPAGQYYYEAQVKFIKLEPQTEPLVIKGWVSVLR
jgi:gliding motility-associated-like protein